MFIVILLFYAKIVAMNIINLYEKYNSYFNKDFKTIFELLSKTASNSGHKLYLIGGLVRDLILNRPSLDIDITVEGNAIEFARILEKECDAKISSIHEDFGTVKVVINDVKIDLASTRNESYPKKGHLPHVDKIGCSLEEDVKRRDFTINSLALSLNKDNFANLVDYVGGFDDLKNKKIRILHDKSFIDDPTRIIRGLKYSSRLGFEVEDKTLISQENYLKNINYDMCYKRVKQEIKKTFSDCTCCKHFAFNQFIDQNIYKLATKREIQKPEIDIENLIQKYNPKHQWLVYLGLITLDENLDKFELAKYEKEVIEGVKNLISKKFTSDLELYKAFGAIPLESLLILATYDKEKEVLHYLNDLKKIKLQITGKDIIDLGFQPSPKFSKALDYVLYKKLKNPKINKTEELKLIKQFMTQ